MDLSRVSAVHYAGMDFGSPSWILLDFDDGKGKQLAFVDSMIHSGDDDGATQLYLRAFQFSFQQLQADVQANRIILSTEKFQGILNKALPMLEAQMAVRTAEVSEFRPNVPVHGFWIWTLARFDDWAVAPLFRHLHLSTKDASSIKFIFR